MYLLAQAANVVDGDITGETLLTVVGITLVTGLVIQAVKLVFSSLSSQWLRRIALAVGVVLAVLVTWSVGFPESANAILLYIVAALNGIVAGLAAGAAFDFAKYGDARVVSPPD